MTSLDDVTRELAAYIDGASAQANGTDSAQARELLDQVRRASLGGKKIRPRIVLATHKELGGRRAHAAAQLGAAAELLHTAFVIHDDVIDGDLMRRGESNVAGFYRDQGLDAGLTADQSDRLANAGAILAGDLALTGAMQIAAGCTVPPPMIPTVLSLLSSAITESAIGELADVRLSTTADASLETVLSMTRRKTAPYSFGLPMQWGALLAGAPKELLTKLGSIGAHLGLAFQLHDDLRGAFAPQQRTGKDALCDLREGKHTALIAHARTTAQWNDLAGLVGDPTLDEAGLQTARRLLRDSGAPQVVTDLAEAELHAATALLEPLPLPPHYSDWLVSLPGQDLGRAA